MKKQSPPPALSRSEANSFHGASPGPVAFLGAGAVAPSLGCLPSGAFSSAALDSFAGAASEGRGAGGASAYCGRCFGNGVPQAGSGLVVWGLPL
eukprot:4876925-Pyramimonas_sp.AAC.1